MVLNDKHAKTKEFVRRHCKGLVVEDLDWENASDPKRYNCFGFAVGVLKWWEPWQRDRSGKVLNPYDYWLKDLPLNATIHSYKMAAEKCGFFECDSGWEPGFEKIALYYMTSSEDKFFTHAVRQVSPDIWKSKFGPLSDIEHKETIGCMWYGDGRVYMKRPRLPDISAAQNPA
jgi:hypothetical protein